MWLIARVCSLLVPSIAVACGQVLGQKTGGSSLGPAVLEWSISGEEVHARSLPVWMFALSTDIGFNSVGMLLLTERRDQAHTEGQGFALRASDRAATDTST